MAKIENVGLNEKYALTVDEAAKYFNIGEKALYDLIKSESTAEFILYRGRRILIKRVLFEKYLDQLVSV